MLASDAMTPLRWLARIPARDWALYGPCVVGGYVAVYVAATYLGGAFTDYEGRFPALLNHPVTALAFSVFVTVLLQASVIAEFAVLFAAAHVISLPTAVALVLGGNIGTCITNTVVSFLSFRDRAQFGRAFAGSIAHDLFNLTMVWLVFPAEVTTQFFSRHAYAVATWLGASDTGPRASILPAMANANAPDPITVAAAGIAAVTGVVMIVYGLRRLFFRRLETTLRDTVFASRGRSFAAGVGFTALMHSSSLSTSMIVPMVGSGAVELRRAFPYLLGCNVGTALVTVTLTLPVLLAGDVHGAATALSHLLFNAYGAALFLALPFLSDGACFVAERVGERVERWSRGRLAVTLGGVYYAAPAVLFLLCLQLL